MFASRAAAGRALAKLLHADADRQLQVLAVSREGVAVGAHVAAAFGADLDLLCSKLSSIALVLEDQRPIVFLDRVVELGLHAAEVAEHLAELRRGVASAVGLYRGHRRQLTHYDRHVVIVDDGSAPAPLLVSALRYVRDRGATRTTVAIPVCTLDALRVLADASDHVICIDQADPRGVALSYADSEAVSDFEALTLIRRTGLAAARIRTSVCGYTGQ